MNSMAHSFYNLQYWLSLRNKHTYTSTCIALNNKVKQSAIKMNCLLMPIKTLSCSTIYSMGYALQKDMQIHETEIKNHNKI